MFENASFDDELGWTLKCFEEYAKADFENFDPRLHRSKEEMELFETRYLLARLEEFAADGIVYENAPDPEKLSQRIAELEELLDKREMQRQDYLASEGFFDDVGN